MRFSLLLILFLICFTSLVYAQDIPGLPTIIQGEVRINDKLAPAGTLISAKVDNVTIKEYTLTEEGKYILTISDFEGKDISLYVDNIFTSQTFKFESGKIVETNLNIEKAKSKWFYWFIPLILILVILLVSSLKRKKSKGFKNNKN